VSDPALDSDVRAVVESLARWAVSPLAIVLGGSRARGAGVRRTVGGESLALSDIDLHVVVADRSARRSTEARIAEGRGALTAELRACGLVAPCEIGVHTLGEWERLPARPATLELAARGRVVHGDPAWLDRLPRWTPRDVPAEEILLLLENRAFELIRAGRDGTADGIDGLLAAHAQYKAALDLATVDRLAAGALESDPASRVTAARAARVARAEIVPEPAWDRALAWLAGVTPDASARRADLDAIVDGWVDRWTALVLPGADPARFEVVARRAASRARLRRRVRLALLPESSSPPPLAARLRFARVGTPQHRLNASAGAWLAADRLARRSPATGELDARLAGILGRLGAVAPAHRDRVAERLLEAWRREVLAGTRGDGAA